MVGSKMFFARSALELVSDLQNRGAALVHLTRCNMSFRR